MKRSKLSLVLLILCILLFTGCSKYRDIKDTINNNEKIDSNEKINSDLNKPLKIIKITSPTSLPVLVNSEDLNDIEFNTNNSDKKIEITFNQDIIDDNYTLGYYTYFDYFSIKNTFDEKNNIFYKYEINKNILAITPVQSYNFTNGIQAIYIPDTIKSVNNTVLEKDRLVIIDEKNNNDGIYIDNDNFDLENQRSFYSQALLKHKNDGINLAYINNHNSYLFSKNDTNSSSLKVYKGENVVIMDEAEDMYHVKMYFKRTPEIDTFTGDFSVENEVSYVIINGYINKDAVTKVIEPYNENISYTITSYLYEDFGEKEYYIQYSAWHELIGSAGIQIYDKIDKIDEIDLRVLESQALTDWIYGHNSSIPYTFLNTKTDESGNPLSDLDEISHMPEINWSEEEYNTYIKAHSLYCEYMTNIIKKNVLVEEMDSFMEDLLHQIDFNLALQKLWIDWAYKNKLENENYIFEKLYEKLDFTHEQAENIKSILEKAEIEFNEELTTLTITDKQAKALLFDRKLYALFNDYNYEDGLKQFNNYLSEMLDKKYRNDESFTITTYSQMKKDANTYFIEQRRLQEIERLEEEKRVQAIIDSGNDISEVDEVFANYLNLSDEEKDNIYKIFYEDSEEYDGAGIYCIVEDKQCVKGKIEVLFKVNIYGIRNEETSKLETDKTYNVIFVSSNDYGAKSSIQIGDKLRLGVKYKKDNFDVLYTDYFMIIGNINE